MASTHSGSGREVPPAKSLQRAWALLPLGFAIIGLVACSRVGPTNEQAEIARVFSSWQTAMVHHQTDQAMTLISHHADDYLARLNTKPTAVANPKPSTSPGVDHLIRTALEKKIPAEIRPQLTLATLLRRATDRNLFTPRDIQQIELGAVSVDGDRATAEIYYAGTLTALRLTFVKEDRAWKIDVIGLLPYAEVLLRVDRAIKGETETGQVDQLVSKLPPL